MDQDRLVLRTHPEDDAREVALLETCEVDWCRVSAAGYRGWMPKAALWGVEPDEVLD